MRLTTFSPGMSRAVTTTTLDQSKAGSRSMAMRRACASVERMVAPYQAPGKTRSSAYFARPVSFSGPSRRLGEAAARPRASSSGPGANSGEGTAGRGAVTVRPGRVVMVSRGSVLRESSLIRPSSERDVTGL